MFFVMTEVLRGGEQSQVTGPSSLAAARYSHVLQVVVQPVQAVCAARLLFHCCLR
jgi:hypothetical protein